jgi:peptidyl-prolyl cis-trans isomerase C
MKSIVLPILISFSIVASLAGCDFLKGDTPDSPVIAHVDKGVITEKDYIKEVSRIPEWARDQFAGVEGKDKFLDELIKRELIYQHAVKMRLTNDQEYLDTIRQFEKVTLVQMVLKKEVEQKAVVDESEVKAFFEENADKFTIGTEIKASHILVETEEEVRDIHAKLEKGTSFASLAKQYSKDKGSADKGGDLGYFGRGKMVPEFERAAASLKPGEVSEPVRTRFGFHLIKLVDIKKGTPANYEQSRESIHKQLVTEKRKKLFDAFVEKLKGQTEVSKDKALLGMINLPWEQQGGAAGQPENTAPTETNR